MTQPSPQWYVLVEENIGRNEGARWKLTQWFPADDQELAIAGAQKAAFEHRPENPMSLQRRTVYRALDGSWLVFVEGAMSDFHFRVTIAERFGETPD